MKPIDDNPMPPPPSGVDTDYLTHDIMLAIERAVIDRVDAIAKERGIGRRDAATIVIRRIREMR